MRTIHVYSLLILSILFNANVVAQNFAWAKSMGSGFTHPSLYIERGTAIVSDINGNIYTTGYFADTVDFDPGVGVFNMVADSTIYFFCQN